ncbi:uncharacterized protein LOC127730577 isoform X2 [Mytilus californianus]|uniref:uncharacterized protein LOC127730577 isoform X2 n=1 Tax=Mytilus californianus TaxID=6549 RepID=UPI0022468DBF|nr:uncharacterized protein LOC127730577 isoform X2 [Mytilus californianus]
MARQRPSLKSYISVNDEDEYKEKICDASSDNGHDNNGVEEKLMNDDVFDTGDESNETSDDKKKTTRTWTLISKSKKKFFIAAVIVVVLIILIGVVIRKSTENDSGQRISLAQNGKQSVNMHKQSEYCLFYKKEGSQYVRNRCPANASHHFCRDCNGQLLPNSCFCDIGQQCNNGDAPRKQTCSWCKDNCPCLHNGTCICDKTGDGLYCKCPAGYNGTYCENIPVRICKKDQVTTELEHCKKSRNETCFIDFQDMSKLKCTLLKEVDKSIANCSSNNMEITTSTK